MNVCVTGASGFVGQALCNVLESHGLRLVRVVRQARTNRDIAVGGIGPYTDWRFALNSDPLSKETGSSVDTVVHLAARVHVMHDEADPLPLYRTVNVEGTEHLAREAARAGVRRLVFVSSIKVNGEENSNRPFTEDDTPNPRDAYAVSKWEAEQRLAVVAA
ncbi:MAG: NAD-dependent epimerase/dehydratase family protein, partial [Deltaproteobacteria bacterium]|nr:NAD-dependent epimerase/dehydratase family protein [Deltaproteobacteria bacterium]